MATIDLTRQQTVLVQAATATATAVPGGATDRLATGSPGNGFATIRTLLDYTGQVDSCAVRLWIYDPGAGTWYEGVSTDDLDPLTPGGASPRDEARDWIVGYGAQVWFQVESVAGGGTVAIRAQGVRS